ncbi:MAG: hypothetical protein V3V49_07545 [Candidatus Krumholzibacteria bacterium]
MADERSKQKESKGDSTVIRRGMLRGVAIGVALGAGIGVALGLAVAQFKKK